MADLDFSDVLVDSDLADTFDVHRRLEVVGTDGRATITEQPPVLGVLGIVVPGDPGNLLRKDDSQMTSRVITITTAFRLRASGATFQPDVVLYDGVRFTVKATKLWNRLGSGFIKAAAASENAYDPAPT